MNGLVGGPLLVGGLGPGPPGAPSPLNPALEHELSWESSYRTCRNERTHSEATAAVKLLARQASVISLFDIIAEH